MHKSGTESLQVPKIDAWQKTVFPESSQIYLFNVHP